MMMQGPDIIKCLSSGGWSSYPYCLRHSQKDSDYCTEEELPPDLMLEETCSRETDTSCNVKCPVSKIIVGPSEITCLSTGRWSDIPFCDDKCDEEARFFSGKCYKLMWKTQGTMAHWKCQTLNMEPLLINDQQVFNFIVDFLKDLNEECLWTSVNDIGNEQVWRDGTGELVTFFNWYPGEPDVGYYGERRDCVAMPKWRNYQYSDYPCIQSLCRFICQYDAKS
ncbi:low affinity immunoglobulin epsilon Fc receptor-like [Tachypleus tridentatus]|uniref:low affinity immunoglobulin epsilon Fc receptor-like n=1 Tax=Tachypleus tridentatus TaxID=6853 RepID=UPI003FD10E60